VSSANDEEYSPQEEELMECLTCPITNEMFYKPVLAADGQIYEETAFMQWWKEKGTSPMTGQRITGNVTRVFNVTSIIDKMIQANPSLKEMRYEPNIVYANNREKIKQFIISHQFEKLKDFKDFDLRDMSTIHVLDTHHLLAYFLKRCNNQMIIHHILDKSLNLKFNHNGNIVNLASINGNLIALKYAIAHEVSPYYKDKDGDDTFHNVCRNGTFESIQYVMGLFEKEKRGWLNYNNKGHDYMTLINYNDQLSTNEKVYFRNYIIGKIKQGAIDEYKADLESQKKTVENKKKTDLEKLQKQLFRVKK